MEKLIEETRLLWCEDCGDGPSRVEYYSGYDDACEGGVETENLCRERAGKVVTRILSAVCDGMPLPDEVGRIPADRLGGGKGEVVRVREGDTIIILRQGGTGKEEEK